MSRSRSRLLAPPSRLRRSPLLQHRRHSPLTYPRNAKLVAGTEVHASAEELPSNRKIDLVWGTVSGGWVVEEFTAFGGSDSPIRRGLWHRCRWALMAESQFLQDSEDYGGVHEVFLSETGVPLAQGGVDVSQTFEMYPTEGPVGTPDRNSSQSLDGGHSRVRGW